MKTPIFSLDGDDLQLFADARAAESHFEAIDVIDETFVMFDADGMRIKVSAESYNSPVVISDYPEPARGPEVLRAALRDKLLRLVARHPEFVHLTADEIEAASLPELVRAMQAVDELFESRSLGARFRRWTSALGWRRD